MKCPRCARILDKEGKGHQRQCQVQYQKDMRKHHLREKKKQFVIQNKLKDPKYVAKRLSELQTKKK